jgi:hypothetical protein
MFFDTLAKGVVGVAVTLAAVCLFDAYFAQTVFGAVVVVLGCADCLFCLGSVLLAVAVAVPSEIQELVTADQIVVDVFFSVFAIQYVCGDIILQGFPYL